MTWTCHRDLAAAHGRWPLMWCVTPWPPPTPDTKLMILLGREAGLRRAEIARVHTDDLLPDGILLVHGKGRRQRTVPLSPLLAAALASRDRGWLFDNPVRPGTPMTPSMVGYRIGQALGGRGTAHQLRHTFATTAYRVSPRNILTVQELLGQLVGGDDSGLPRLGSGCVAACGGGGLDDRRVTTRAGQKAMAVADDLAAQGKRKNGRWGARRYWGFPQ